MRYIQWERGIVKLFKMIPQNLDMVKMVILNTLRSEKARDAVFTATSYDGIIQGVRALMWNIGFRERAHDILKTIKQGDRSVSEYDKIFSDLAGAAGIDQSMELLVALLLNGLNPGIRAACLGDTTNMVVLRTKALAVEKVLRQMDSVGQQNEMVACAEDKGSEGEDEECLHIKGTSRRTKKEYWCE